MDEISSVYMVRLMYEAEPAVSEEDILERLTARIGEVELMRPSDVPQPELQDALNFVFPNYRVRYADGSEIPVGCNMIMLELKPRDWEGDHDLVQSWNWRQAKSVVPNCRWSIMVNDFLALGLPYKDRLALFHNIVMSVLDVAPCSAIHWMPSQQFVDPASYVLTKDSPDPDPIYPAINVRLYNIQDREPGECVMDSIGVAALGGLDVQCHFIGLDPTDVAQMIGNSAYYIFNEGDVVKDGETIQGVGEGTRWRCRHEDALLPPGRPVLDIDPGPPYSAGEREPHY